MKVCRLCHGFIVFTYPIKVFYVWFTQLCVNMGQHHYGSGWEKAELDLLGDTHKLARIQFWGTYPPTNLHET